LGIAVRLSPSSWFYDPTRHPRTASPQFGLTITYLPWLMSHRRSHSDYGVGHFEA